MTGSPTPTPTMVRDSHCRRPADGLPSALADAIETFRKKISKGAAPELTPEDRERAEQAAADLLASGEEIFRDQMMTLEDFDSLQRFNDALDVIFDLLEEIGDVDGTLQSTIEILLDVVRGIFGGLEDGFRIDPRTGKSTIKKVTFSDEHGVTCVCFDLNEGEGIVELNLISVVLGIFAIDLEIYKDTKVKVATGELTLEAVPGTVRVDFDDFSIFGIHIAGPCLPDDFWLEKMKVGGGAYIRGSEDQEGTIPVRINVNERGQVKCQAKQR